MCCEGASNMHRGRVTSEVAERGRRMNGECERKACVRWAASEWIAGDSQDGLFSSVLELIRLKSECCYMRLG